MPSIETETSVITDIDTELLATLDDGKRSILLFVYTTSKIYQRDWWININKTTFLTNHDTGDDSQLIPAMNIPYPPEKVLYHKTKGNKHYFNFIFPKIIDKSWDCYGFAEKTAYSVGIYIPQIIRNNSGTYRLKLN